MARVRLTSLQLFAVKLGIFSTVLFYLAIDLWVWHGPVWSYIHRGAAEKDTSNLVASVYGEDLSKAQLARLSRESDWQRGLEEPDPKRRGTHLMDLIRRTMLRITTRYNDRNLPLCRREAEAEVARLASRAGSDEAFESQLRTQGYTRESFTDKVQSQMRSQALLERAIEPYCDVSDEAVDLHYERVCESLRIPEHRALRHLFLELDGHEPAEVKARAEALLAELKAGADFAELARSRSEDQRSAPNGGELGMVYNDGNSPLAELPIFGEQAIPADTPTLVESRWGWHILVAGPLIPSHIPTADECRESLRSAIRSAQRGIAVDAYFDAALDEARHKKRIRIYAQ